MQPTRDVLATLRNSSRYQGAGFSALSMNTGVTQNTWQQILPAGLFKAVDGRPFDVSSRHWFLDRYIATQVINDVRSRSTQVVIDYEHQTLESAKNGKPAPAAGWVEAIEWREGSGLWIKPSWTARAKEHILGREYRYLSAVFPYDKSSGTPLSLHSVALVNTPGIDGMAEVASLKSSSSFSDTRSLGLAALSSAEKSALDKAYVTTDSYLNKREAFCRSRGTSWAELSALTPEEQQVIRSMCLDRDAFISTKLHLLAEEILRGY